jgi:hypothetical protein
MEWDWMLQLAYFSTASPSRLADRSRDPASIAGEQSRDDISGLLVAGGNRYMQ